MKLCLKRIMYVMVVGVLLASCGNHPPDTSLLEASKTVVAHGDTISYVIETVNRSIKCDTSICAEVEFSYPVFQAHRGDSLNAWLRRKLSQSFFDTTMRDSYQAAIQEYLDTAHNWNTEREQPAWDWQLSMEVDHQYNDLVTLHRSQYTYSGGAHPSHHDDYFHYDLWQRQSITLDSMLIPGGRMQLTQIAEKVFRREFEMSADSSLTEAGFFFDKGVFSLPYNYTFTKDAIRFHYNEYEMRAYVYGPYDLDIPLDQIHALARPGSYLSGMISAVH